MPTFGTLGCCLAQTLWTRNRIASIFYHWHCDSCGYDEQSGAAELLQRLRSIGVAKRDDGRDRTLLLALAQSKSGELACPRCRAVGLSVEVAKEEAFDGSPSSRDCSACGQRIPRERVDLFPDNDLCARCQGKLDEGGQLSGDDYCPHCGTPMVMRKTTRGVTRFEQTCPRCRR